MTSSTSTCMEYTEKIRDVTGAPNFKEISSFLNCLQETFAPLLGHRDAAEVIVKQPTDKLTPHTHVHRSNKKQTPQRIPDVKSQDEFPALGVTMKKTPPQ